MGRWLAIALGCLLGGCTLISAQGFDECSKDSDCGSRGLCLERYCVRPPEGCDQSEGQVDDPRRIPLGAALPLSYSGEPDDSERQGLNALLLALGEINQREGVAGRPFALYVCNSDGDAERIKEQAGWLSRELRAPVVFTSGSAQTIAASTVTIPSGTVVMSATSTSPEITSLHLADDSVRLVWRTAPSDAIQGKVISSLLLTDPVFVGVTRVGVLYVDDPYGQGLKEVLASGLEPEREIRTFQFARGGDLTLPLADLAAFAPQVTVLIGFPDDVKPILELAAQTPALRRANGHRWFLTDAAKDPSILSGAGGAELELAYGTAPAQGAGAAFSSFRDRFRTKYQVNPEDFAFTSHSYDAMYVSALGAAFATGPDGSQPVTGARVGEGLTKLSSGALYRLAPDQFTQAKNAIQRGSAIDIEGASGTLNFDPKTGEAPSAIELWQVQSGGFTTLRTIQQ